MKNLIKMALVGAAVLVAASCQRESVEGSDNPNFNRETNEVVTNFVFNVATQARTKQSADATQATSSNAFRGLVDAKLFTYAIDDAEYKGILPADADAGKIFDLAQLATSSQISHAENRRILELSLPLKTNTLLFYGRAPLGTAYDGYANLSDCYGHMDAYDINTTSGSTDFQAGRRLADSEYTKFLIVENLFAGIQTMLLYHNIAAGVVINKDDAPNGVATTYTFDATIPAGGIKWEDYNSNDGKSPYNPAEDRFPLEVKLGALYKQLTTIRTADGELRAGSGEATCKMAADLLTVLNEIRCAAPLNASEAVAKYFANEVFNRTLKYFSGDTNNTGAPITSVTFNSQASILAAYLSDEETAFRPHIDASIYDAPEIFWPTQSQLSTVSDAKYAPKDFPFNFNLPRGAAYIAFDQTAKIFYYPQQFNVSGMEGGVPTQGITYNGKSYYYPAELLYFGNSPIRTSSNDKALSDYPKGSGNGGTGTALDSFQWCNENAWGSDWGGTKVAASTRAVAMKYNINYGVAVLKTQVKFAPDAGNVIHDNNHAVQVENNPGAVGEFEELDNNIDVVDNMFALTGIIIGGQSAAIGWDHLPAKLNAGTPDEAYEYGFVYDKAIPSNAQGIPATGKSNPNYTLVFDNFNGELGANGIYTPAAHQNKVAVALEFRNDSGKDFYGNHNLIRNGGYFYLIGQLDPEAAGLNTITWPDQDANGNITHIVPPYTAAGGSQRIPRIFIQDFMTTATFTIGPNSLHYAYLTVPDLRSTSMTLGLSVDLSWETGLDFEDVILGGN